MRHNDRCHRPSRTNKVFRLYHAGLAFTVVLLLVTVFSGSAAALDINDTDSLDYWSDTTLDFRVETDGTITAYGNLNMQNSNNITDFFDTTACATDQFVTRLYANGSYQCTDASSIDTTVADDQNLSEVLTQGNIANQTIEFSNGIEIGDSSTTVGGYPGAVAVGNGANASGGDASAVGKGASASGYAASAFGHRASASGDYASAVGYGADASGSQASAFGYGADASAYAASAVGSYADASGNSASAVGYSAFVSARYASAFGRDASASAEDALAVGSYAEASGYAASAVGRSADASATGAVAIGYYAYAPNSYEATFGNLNGEELDVNVTGDLTVHGSGGLDMKGNELKNVGGLNGDCPSGYVWVPGSAKFGTNPGFCVMKFEAKDDGSGNPISTATDSILRGDISQVDAKKKCRNLGDGYHLISEREWMTLAYQISNNPNNWGDGTIGSKASNNGGLFMGNVAPPSSHSHLGYDGPNPDTRSTGDRPNSARLELENGNYVWDLSGNVWEWTSTRIYTHNGAHESPQQNEANGDESWHELDEITDWRGLSESRPPRVWDSSQGIGRIWLNGDDTWNGNNNEYNQRSAVRRGGHWNDGQNAGLFGVRLAGAPSDTNSDIGFRCTKTPAN